jgi:hypothetical protein
MRYRARKREERYSSFVANEEYIQVNGQAKEMSA